MVMDELFASVEEKDRHLSQLRSVARTGTAVLEGSASAYMQAQGWRKAHYEGDVFKGGLTYFLFTFGLMGRTYAIEKPLLLRLTVGQVYAKISLFNDGLDSVIDPLGREHRFLLDRWILV